MMQRDDAIELLKKHIKNGNLLKHCYAVEAGMNACAQKLNHEAARWAMAGLLHDIDYDYTASIPEQHGLKAMELLEGVALDKEILQAIKSHGGNCERTSLMDDVLYAVDPLTGLIIAAALLHPEKKISALTTEFIQRRMKEKGFAKGANRDAINSCTSFMPLDDFIACVLDGMQSIKDVLQLG